MAWIHSCMEAPLHSTRTVRHFLAAAAGLLLFTFLLVSRGFCSAFLTPPLFAADGFVAVSLSLGAGSLPCAATPLGFAAFREAIVVVVLLTHSVATLPGA